jgi:hypothetical protein
METKINLTEVEISITDTALLYKTVNPFSVSTIKKEDFAGVNVIEEKELPHSDWNYAFRFGGIGLVLMLISFGIGYNISGGSTTGIGLVFVYIGVAFAQLITIGALIIFLSFFDGFFGTRITQRLLLKFFGKTVIKVVIASLNNDNIFFYLQNDSDKQKVEEILKLNKIFDRGKIKEI